MLSVIFSLTQNFFFHVWEYFPVPRSASISQTVLSACSVQDLSTGHPCLSCCLCIAVSIGKKDGWTRKEVKNQRTQASDMLWSTPADSLDIPQAWRCLGIIPGVLIQLVVH